MTENVDKQEFENNQLICPITLEYFRDPVKAKDGHVYERQAITRWILQHGTSPLTREPLNINDLQTDEYLTNLARQRRSSTVSYHTYDEQVTLPPIRTFARNSSSIVPIGILNSGGNISETNRHRRRVITLAICFFLVPITIIIAIVLAMRNIQGPIQSVYSGQLTSNSSIFNRLNSSTSGQSYYYDRIGINLSKDGIYQIRSQSLMDMYGLFYLNYFNSTNKDFNLLNENNDHRRNQQFYFQISLQTNQFYILVATTAFPNTTGTFSVSVLGPATVTFN